MKKFLFFIAFVLCQTVSAQSEYISHSPSPDNECLADLDGDCGILILSKRSDLVICVTNVTDDSKYSVKPVGLKKDLYHYEVRINKDETNVIKIEVSRRGDVYKTNFVVRTKPNYYKAFQIDEVQRPIRMEDQTQSTSAVLDETLAEVEFTSSIADLHVECPAALEAKISSTRKTGDNTISIITVTIPVKNLDSARQKLANAQKTHADFEKNLYTKQNAPDSEWEQLDRLQDEMEQAEQEMAALSHITISGSGTNKLQVDIGNLGPRQKLCYGVLLLKVEVPVNEFSAKVAEAGRLFALRDYEGARRTFVNASQLKEAPADLVPTLKSNIAYCDSCIKYERLTIAALKRIGELKSQDAIAQTDITNYYGAAADFLRITEKYNPCEYYSKNIKVLETYIENMPLAMKFTIAKWTVTRVSAQENGAFPNVELWAYYGGEQPRLNDYRTDRKFRKLVSENSGIFKQLGTSDAEGVVNMELRRNNLPTGFFFRPASKDEKAGIVYKDMTDIMAQSVGEYNKRQFRMKMYTK